MNVFVGLIEVLLTISVLTHLVGQYLVVNKLWPRRAVKEVSESISISAAFLGLATSLPFLIHFVVIQRDPASAIRIVISIGTGIVFVLIGSGLFVRQYRGRGFTGLVLGALRLERKESADLVKALVQPKGANELIRIFETMATVDKHVDTREIEMIEQFARRWRVDPPSLREGDVEEQGDIVALREHVVAYLQVSPPPEQAEELLDVLHLFVQADAHVSTEEELVLEELTGLITQYVSGSAGERTMYEVVIVPQSDEQIDAVRSLLPGVESKSARGGTVFSAGRFFSSRYAEAVCAKYIALGLFTATVDP